jgi:hypothetical protein
MRVRFHLATALLLQWILGAVIWANIKGAMVGLWTHEGCVIGWDKVYSPGWPIPFYRDNGMDKLEFSFCSFFVDLLLALLLFALAVFVGERWYAKRRASQQPLKSGKRHDL